jgi:nucleoside-diphosphate-sugar epimerase
VTAHDSVDARPWLILGCGYTGEVLARQLVAANAQVTIVRRDAAALAAIAARVGKARAVVASLADAASLAAVASLARDANVVLLAPPAGIEDALARALKDSGAHRLVYISTSGVYGPARGARVDEDWPTAPATPAGHARLAAEGAIAASGLAHVILRAPGIYGPGRGVAARLRAGTYRIIGDGTAHVSRVHVEDLASAIIAAATATAPPRTIYNVADRDPCTAAEHGDGAAAMLHLPPPPRTPADQVSPDVAGMLLADRRLDASRLERELGWTPRYPSWRDALAAELGACRS